MNFGVQCACDLRLKIELQNSQWLLSVRGKHMWLTSIALHCMRPARMHSTRHCMDAGPANIVLDRRSLPQDAIYTKENPNDTGQCTNQHNMMVLHPPKITKTFCKEAFQCLV